MKYRDSTLTMDADRGTYYKNGERWEARGNVDTKNLTYRLDAHRARRSTTSAVVKGVRDTLEMYATGRPDHPLRRVRQRAAGKAVEPYLIVADRVRFKGNDRIWAGGKVTIDRSDFAARSDSMRLDTGAGQRRHADRRRADPPRASAPTASGWRASGSISGSTQRELNRVVARGEGHAVNRDWDLTADTIAIDLKNRKLERTLAWGKQTRPYAVSTAYAMRADSLALDSPGQLLKEVRGFGKAWLGGTVDSVDARTATGCAATPSSRSSRRPTRPARSARC